MERRSSPAAVRAARASVSRGSSVWRLLAACTLAAVVLLQAEPALAYLPACELPIASGMGRDAQPAATDDALCSLPPALPTDQVDTRLGFAPMCDAAGVSIGVPVPVSGSLDLLSACDVEAPLFGASLIQGGNSNDVPSVGSPSYATLPCVLPDATTPPRRYAPLRTVQPTIATPAVSEHLRRLERPPTAARS